MTDSPRASTSLRRFAKVPANPPLSSTRTWGARLHFAIEHGWRDQPLEGGGTGVSDLLVWTLSPAITGRSSSRPSTCAIASGCIEASRSVSDDRQEEAERAPLVLRNVSIAAREEVDGECRARRPPDFRDPDGLSHADRP